MAVKTIITTAEDEAGILSQKTIPLKVGDDGNIVFTDSHKQVIQDMKDTTVSISALGLAANQIGHPFSIMLITTPDGHQVIINPTLVGTKGKAYSFGENCLSAGGPVDIKRHKFVILKGFDEEGKPLTIRSKSKMTAFVIQHEIDHLNGLTILDR